MLSRRHFLARSTPAAPALASLLASAFSQSPTPTPAAQKQARVAITLDLEMARNFPNWEDQHWDYEKGLLNPEAKHYATEAARRVRQRGFAIHFFVVGRVLEQADIDWLKKLRDDGHVLGNHTYDHVNVLATRPQDLQFRFSRAPWLIQGKSPAQVIRENIQLCSDAMISRLQSAPVGFRTPGGFAQGLHGREDIQQLLLDLGFPWISCKYPAHPYGAPQQRATRQVLDGIVAAQKESQPFAYPTGLIDIPMSPISDVGAFRNARWPLEDFLAALHLALDWTFENHAVFDFLGHPSVLYPNDPKFKIIDALCDRVQAAGSRATLATLNTIAQPFLPKSSGSTPKNAPAPPNPP